jgi:TRAP transporter TAXI family solute receptor
MAEKYGQVYFPEVIPAGTYPGQKTDNHQLSVGNIIAVLDTMPDEQAAKILDVIWSNRGELAQVHAEAKNFTLDKQKTAAAGVPWHPAAEAYWKKQGAQLA